MAISKCKKAVHLVFLFEYCHGMINSVVENTTTNFDTNSSSCVVDVHQTILTVCRFKFAVYRQLGNLETVDQIRAGR